MGCSHSSAKDKLNSISRSSGTNTGNTVMTRYRCYSNDGEGRQQIPWSDIHLNGNDPEVILGSCPTGLLAHAIWKNKNRENPVLLKVFANLTLSSAHQNDYEESCNNAWREYDAMKEAERKLTNNDCIVRLYGVCEGEIPKELASLHNLDCSFRAVAIVTKYEKAGTLERRLHHNPLLLYTQDKIRLLVKVAEALVELHSSGVVHGDIRSSNVWLSHHNPPEIKLSDFGLADFMDVDGASKGSTSLQLTNSHGVFTKYYAPERLQDPLSDVETVARASRKTDVYSFGILMWEVMTRCEPFADVTSEGVLCARIHKRHRPDIAKLSPDVPKTVESLMVSCWDKERSKRPSAVECHTILQHCFDTLVSGKFDIFFSHAWAMKPMLSHVYQILSKSGYRVWYDQNNMGYDLKESMKRGIKKSKVVIACVNQLYQERENCMFELRTAATLQRIPIVSLVMDPEPLKWASNEIKTLCNLQDKMYVDISTTASLSWSEDDGPTPAMLALLRAELAPLFKILDELKVKPSMETVLSSLNT